MTSQHWTLIESGSTQEFIFQSNRQRFHVGASALVTDLATWVRDATDGVPGVFIVSAISASAVLLVEDADAGRAVVREVSERALREAPGLDVWGYVEPDAAATDGDLMSRLAGARQALNRTRALRPGAKARFPMAPFFDQCAVTGLPAVGKRTMLGDRAQPVSALTNAVWRRAVDAHAEWRRLLGEAVVSDLDRDLSPEGWVAVIHADGNGIGACVDELASPEAYASFSTALEAATRNAFVTATREVDARQWLLPILVGGDDVTLICRASVAATFTRAYLRAFESASEARLPDGQRLTAAAGVAFVKPHYPFSEAHVLAQQLTRSAKQGLRQHGATDRSAWDFHVLHDSLARPLDEVREHQHAVVVPLLTGGTDRPPADVWQAAHDDEPLMRAVEELVSATPPLSNKARHALRAALLQPPANRDGAVRRVRERAVAVGGESAATFIREHLDDRMAHDAASLLTVMDLADVATGTSKAVN